MDFLALFGLIALAALVMAFFSGKGLLAWARDEWRLMRAETFGPQGPTHDEERAAKLLYRQRALAKRMRKKGTHLYAGKTYTPTLTTPTPAKPPKADAVVVQLRRRTGT